MKRRTRVPQSRSGVLGITGPSKLSGSLLGRSYEDYQRTWRSERAKMGYKEYENERE